MSVITVLELAFYFWHLCSSHHHFSVPSWIRKTSKPLNTNRPQAISQTLTLQLNWTSPPILFIAPQRLTLLWNGYCLSQKSGQLVKDWKWPTAGGTGCNHSVSLKIWFINNLFDNTVLELKDWILKENIWFVHVISVKHLGNTTNAPLNWWWFDVALFFPIYSFIHNLLLLSLSLSLCFSIFFADNPWTTCSPSPSGRSTWFIGLWYGKGAKPRPDRTKVSRFTLIDAFQLKPLY